MKNIIRKFIAAFLLTAIFIASPHFLAAQTKLVGELTFSANKSGAVTVNGEPAVSGRSIMSPSEIATISLANAKVAIPKTGVVQISPNSRIRLSFTDSSISIDLLGGEFVVETMPNTVVNILTPDGAITVSDRTQANSFRVKNENGGTRVDTTLGEVKFNNIVIPAGDSFPKQTVNTVVKDDAGGKSKDNSLLLIGLLGAGAAVAVLVLLGASGGSDSSPAPVVSPTR